MSDDLKKIKGLVEIVVNKVRSMETHQSVAAEQVRFIRDQQQVMNEKLDTIEEKIDAHTGSLIKIEDTLQGYADMYKTNKEKNEELKERVEVIEGKLSVSSKN